MTAAHLARWPRPAGVVLYLDDFRPGVASPVPGRQGFRRWLLRGAVVVALAAVVWAAARGVAR